MIGLMAWSSINSGRGLPNPKPMVGAAAAFTLTAFLAEFSPPIAGILSLGILVGYATKTFGGPNQAALLPNDKAPQGTTNLATTLSSQIQAAGTAATSAAVEAP